MRVQAAYLSAVFLLLFPQAASAQESGDDAILQDALRRGKIGALTPPPADPPARVRLGQALFVDPLLSGNRDIACVHCHHPRFASGDGMPLAIGTGGKGMGPLREQLLAPLTRRHAQPLFNLGRSAEHPMFWDGRVSFSAKSHSFETPEPALNGYFPLHPHKRHPVARALDSSLAAQAIFPLVAEDEMRGPAGTNEIADAPDNLAAWERIVARLLRVERYRRLFAEAFPGVPEAELNIGHVGTAIAAFERQAFVAADTPFDRYLRGEKDALTPRQKRGAALFVGKARCVQCHSGPELTNHGFHTTATPQVGVPRADGLPREDLGRFEVEPSPWLKEIWRSSFRTQPLRNLALTAPYMHDGAFATIEEVVRHYNDPAASVESHRAPEPPKGYRDRLASDAGTPRARERLSRLDERLREPLGLTEDEIAALVDFLRDGLLDPAWGVAGE